MHYYLDTSIWLDLYENRGDNGERALRLTKQWLREKGTLLSSDLHVVELKQLGYAVSEIKQVLERATSRIHVSRAQSEEARVLASRLGVPWGDALHAVLARDNDAILVSNDRDFEKLRNVTEVRTTYG